MIAINKKDHPAAKTMLNEVRSILTLDHESAWKPPIVLTEAVQDEGVAELWDKVAEHRAYLEEESLLDERRRRNLAGEVFAVASARAKAHLEQAVEGDPELQRVLEEVQKRELDPLTAVQEIMEKVFHLPSGAKLQSGSGENRMATKTAPTFADVEAARERLAGKGVRVTPVYSSETFTRRTGRPVLLKAENLQRTGSFKVRGAVNKMESLSEVERRAGVVTASAGNHGQAVAWAAREEGLEATVFMPSETPMTKVDATRNYGATVELTGHVFEDAVREAVEHAAQPERRSSMRSRIRS